MRFLKHAVIYIVFTAMAVVGGKSCSNVQFHPSGNATYIEQDACIVNTGVTHEEFILLTTWCTGKHNEQ